MLNVVNKKLIRIIIDYFLITSFTPLLVVCNVIQIDSNSSKLFQKPEFIRYNVQSSSDQSVIKLECTELKDKGRKYLNGITEMHWEYENCGEGLHMTPCSNLENAKWKSVMCKNGSKLCDGFTIALKNLRKRDSGYYRCLYKNYMSKQFKIFKLFQLEVVDPQSEMELVAEPNHIDNQTVYVNEDALFRCRAYSLSPLYMVWFKLTDDHSKYFHNRLITYRNQSYEYLKSDMPVKFSNNLYVSKLKIPNCQVSHSGYYLCVVIGINAAQVNKTKIVSLSVISSPASTGRACSSSFAPHGMILILKLIYFLMHY